MQTALADHFGGGQGQLGLTLFQRPVRGAGPLQRPLRLLPPGLGVAELEHDLRAHQSRPHLQPERLIIQFRLSHSCQRLVDLAALELQSSVFEHELGPVRITLRQHLILLQGQHIVAIELGSQGAYLPAQLSGQIDQARLRRAQMPLRQLDLAELTERSGQLQAPQPPLWHFSRQRASQPNRC